LVVTSFHYWRIVSQRNDRAIRIDSLNNVPAAPPREGGAGT
jgi:hypothetical protein